MTKNTSRWLLFIAATAAVLLVIERVFGPVVATAVFLCSIGVGITYGALTDVRGDE